MIILSAQLAKINTVSTKIKIVKLAPIQTAAIASPHTQIALPV